MKSRFLVGLASIMAGLFCGCATAPSSVSTDTRLAVPTSVEDRQYLGLADTVSEFRLDDIQCEVLVIDCFDMYCHICQAGAKHVNELYRLAEAGGLGSRVKFVGLGLGDTPLEVATYKEKFKVPFPVFPDRRSVIAKQFGPIKLPNLIILRKQGRELEVNQSIPGSLLDPQKVLTRIQTALAKQSVDLSNDGAQASQPTCLPSCPACRRQGASLSRNARKPDS